MPAMKGVNKRSGRTAEGGALNPVLAGTIKSYATHRQRNCLAFDAVCTAFVCLLFMCSLYIFLPYQSFRTIQEHTEARCTQNPLPRVSGIARFQYYDTNCSRGVPQNISCGSKRDILQVSAGTDA